MNTSIVLVNEENPVLTSMQAVSMEDKKRFYNAINSPTGDIKDIVNNDVTITDFHMGYEEKMSDDGEFYKSVKTTIVLNDGRSYSTTYKSFAKSLIQLMQIFGTPENWENHEIRIKVRTVSYGGGMHDGLTIDVL